MFSLTVEYALRSVVYLAGQAPAARTTEQIAQATQVPRAYLSKVLQSLRRADIVRSRRGIGGGVTLAKNPETMTLLDVVNAVDPLTRIATCPLKPKAHGTRLCPLHRRMDEAMAHIEEAFQRTTVAEILADPSPSSPMCLLPASAAQATAAQNHRRRAAAP